MSISQVSSANSKAEQYTQELKEQFDRLAGPDADTVDLYQLPAVLKQQRAPEAGVLGAVTEVRTQKGEYTVLTKYDENGEVSSLEAHRVEYYLAEIHIVRENGGYRVFVVKQDPNNQHQCSLFGIDANGLVQMATTAPFNLYFRADRAFDYHAKQGELVPAQDKHRERVRQIVFDFVQEMLS